jgi:ubiquinone/menaquinone biosynthesis C-methylase UbiE
MTSNHPSPLSEKAVAGFANAASYDRHRPSYPSEAVTLLLKAVGVHGFQRSRVIDLAAGTGIFTELLAVREEQFDILAVEPHDEMRAQLTRKALKNVEIADGSSSSIPVEDNSVDAVFAAQVRL